MRKRNPFRTLSYAHMVVTAALGGVVYVAGSTAAGPVMDAIAVGFWVLASPVVPVVTFGLDQEGWRLPVSPAVALAVGVPLAIIVNSWLWATVAWWAVQRLYTQGTKKPKRA